MTKSIADCLGSAGYYEKHGEDALLLVHGLTGTPAEMRPVAKRAARAGFSVLCPVLSGHCLSERDLDRSTWRQWYGTVADSFEALKAVHRRVYVAGLSKGALLTILLAANEGDRVDGIALLSSTFFYDGWNMPQWKRRLLLPLVLYSPLRYFLHWQETPPYGIKCERTRAMVHAVLEHRDAQASQKVGIFRTSALIIHESLRLVRVAKSALPRVKSPALIIHATEDDTASLKNAHYVAQRIKSRRIETFFVEDSYHVLTLDKRRNDVGDRMAVFFQECGGQS